MFQQLTLASLDELDGGKASLMFLKHLTRAANDCLDRPTDAKARVITLKFSVEPVVEIVGDREVVCEKVKFYVEAQSTVPAHKSRPYEATIRHNGQLAFNVDSPTNVDQATLLPTDPGGDES